jgi:hypothetical protein
MIPLAEQEFAALVLILQRAPMTVAEAVAIQAIAAKIKPAETEVAKP